MTKLEKCIYAKEPNLQAIGKSEKPALVEMLRVGGLMCYGQNQCVLSAEPNNVQCKLKAMQSNVDT